MNGDDATHDRGGRNAPHAPSEAGGAVQGNPDRLAVYRGTRHFDRTQEPRGAPSVPGDAPCFVVQIHDARRMHFDFRLEVDGVLKSWSVPKGPSADPRDKRLAVPTEDHPLDYREFEGVIARGEYGAGTVIVWDQGTYRPLPGKRRDHVDGAAGFAEALERGHVSFWLDGTKLHGGYALTRFRTGEEAGDRESWLLVKENDDRAAAHGAPDPLHARSVRSGRTIRQVAADARDDPPRGF
ncbi:DNA polymerase ligase N-terminal domain-containing protein [Streptomyces benahoarensis]|uniref:3'-phosphoesterase n=1 Tax=Streptomyces benahoarensis TaxID=2595054 RepID=A0A553ZKB1_9ACTN|nr:DNA polymerase ligase N-terminal domain-containing protein [Streptomyces benahoarensis]TSB24537.1 3'-phosphoesterase [Streptomyces benahoarensis]TSB41857.1 3'-phosphoesterase [Streptomyces benahoarensis]